jgi:urate oxidase
MPHELTWNRYGKSSVRLLKARRATGSHDIVDLTLAVALEGAFEAVYVDGDNASCLTTDAMKNTVYAFARQDPIEHVEAFASRLAGHFAAKSGVTLARIEAVEHPWTRLSVGGQPHPYAFARAGAEEWTTVVTQSAGQASVESGVRGLVVLKTADSAFAGFLRDQYTTLPETRDRCWTSVTGTGNTRQASLSRRAPHHPWRWWRPCRAQERIGAAHPARDGEAALVAPASPRSRFRPQYHYLLPIWRRSLDKPGKALFVANRSPMA